MRNFRLGVAVNRSIFCTRQCENKRSPPSSPFTLNSLMSRLSPPMGQKVSCIQNATRNNDAYDYGSSMEKTRENSPLDGDGKRREIRQLIKVREISHGAIWGGGRGGKTDPASYRRTLLCRNWRIETAN